MSRAGFGGEESGLRFREEGGKPSREASRWLLPFGFFFLSRAGTLVNPNSTHPRPSKLSPSQPSTQPLGYRYDPLAVLLIHAAMHLLFLPQLTLDFSALDDDFSSEPNTPTGKEGLRIRCKIATNSNHGSGSGVLGGCYGVLVLDVRLDLRHTPFQGLMVWAGCLGVVVDPNTQHSTLRSTPIPDPVQP